MLLSSRLLFSRRLSKGIAEYTRDWVCEVGSSVGIRLPLFSEKYLWRCFFWRNQRFKITERHRLIQVSDTVWNPYYFSRAAIIAKDHGLDKEMYCLLIPEAGRLPESPGVDLLHWRRQGVERVGPFWGLSSGFVDGHLVPMCSPGLPSMPICVLMPSSSKDTAILY